MRKRKQISAWVVVMAVAIGAVALPGCGGGSSGGGGGGQVPGFLTLLGAPTFGNLSGGNTTSTPYPTLPVTGVPVPTAAANTFTGPAYAVPAAVFNVGAANSTDFVEMSFNVPLTASSVTSTPPSGTDGIVIQDDLGNSVPFFLDSTGSIDPANTFPSADVAPANLKIYFSASPTLDAGSYVLSITNNLKSFTGGPFCTTNPGTQCVNDILPRFPFSMNTDTLDQAMDGVNPSNPIQGDPAVPINSEIVLNFKDAVDLQQVVGSTNVSTLDPFVSVPIGFANVDCTMTVLRQFFGFSTTAGAVLGNIFIGYTPPLDFSTTPPIPEAIPQNMGCLVYMPDPILNPTQIRVRFVDNTNLQGRDMPTAQIYQNYSSGNFNIPSSDPAQGSSRLALPPVLPVPGSLPPSPLGVQTATCEIAVYGEYLGDGSMMDDYMSPPLPAPPAMPPFCFMSTTGTLGMTQLGPGTIDRSNNILQNTFYLTFTWAEGPVLAQNPIPPDAAFVGIQTGVPGIAAINGAGATTSLGPPPMCPATPNYQAPITYGTVLTAALQLAPGRLANPATLGFPQDILVGDFLLTGVNPNQGSNHISNPPRGMLGVPGVPDQQDGTGPTGLLGVVLGACGGAPQQPLGNYLYVVDGDAGTVKVFNSYNFQLITTLIGIASPGGLGMTPNLQDLYISNSGQGTVQRVVANPVSPLFHTISNTIVVGNGPTAVAAQPGGEDVFVCNTAENTYSIIDVGTQVERIKLATGLGPKQVWATNRMLGMFLTNAYQAFILNEFGDSVTVYESDSPAVPENGLDGRQVAQQGGFFSPRRGSWNWRTYIGFTNEPGGYVVNSQGTTVDEFTMFNFVLSPPPGFPGPPGRRDFHVLKAFSSASLGIGQLVSPSSAVLETHTGLYNVNVAGITNNKGACDPSAGGGVPSLVLVSYPAAGLVAGFDAQAPTLLSTVSVPGCDFLATYYTQ